VAHAPAVASEVEAALAALSDSKEYAAKARSLLFNLLKNDELRKTVLLRQLSAEQLVRGTPRPTGRRLPARPFIFRLSNGCLFVFRLSRGCLFFSALPCPPFHCSGPPVATFLFSSSPSRLRRAPPPSRRPFDSSRTPGCQHSSTRCILPPVHSSPPHSSAPPR